MFLTANQVVKRQMKFRNHMVHYGTVIIWCVILRVLADSAALLPCLGNYVAFLFMFALRA